MNLEQRIARALEDSLTDEEFDTLSAEADAEPTFRDARPLSATPAPLPLDHDGRGPRVDTRCGDLPADWQSQLDAELAEMRETTRRIRKLAS
jgi:hypothetical protein